MGYTLGAPAPSPSGYPFGAPPPSPSDYTVGSTPPARFDFDSALPGEPAVAPPDVVKEKPRRESSTSFDIACTAEVPLMAGGQATLELPYRILLQGEVGVLPAAYINGIDGALTGAGVYDAAMSQLVRSALQNSLIVRASTGFRPFSNHGLEIMGGYTLVSLGLGVSARQAADAITGSSLGAEIPDLQVQFHTTMHNLHASLGWRWVVADHFVVRASIAYLQTVASSSSLAIPGASTAVATRVAAANETVDAKMNDTYTKYAKMPVMGLSVGYRF